MSIAKIKRFVFAAIAVIAIIMGIIQFFNDSATDTNFSGSSPSAVSSSLPAHLESSRTPEDKSESGEKSSESSRESHNYHWGNPKTLQDHFDRHGADFHAKSPEDYARMANEFYNNRENYQVKVDDKGDTRVFDSETNTFGAYNKNGTTKSFYIASGGQAYFDRQPGE